MARFCSRFRLCAVLTVTLALAGCATAAVMSHVPLAALKKMWSFDLNKLDIPGLRVATRLPEELEPREVTVIIEAKGDAATSKRREEITLEPTLAAAELAPLARYQRSGFRVFIYQVAAADIERLDAMRAVKNGGHGTIAVGVKACRRRDLPKGALLSTTLLRTDDGGYFVMLDNLDLRAIVTEAEFAAEVPSCGTARRK